MAYSYDVFDTVLTRLVGEPTSLFYLVGKKGIEEGVLSCTPKDYHNARIQAERVARQEVKGREDTCFADIIEKLGKILSLNDVQLSRLSELELAFERRVCARVKALHEELCAKRDGGGRVLFISDMYHEEGFIRSLLEDLDLIKNWERLYVSSILGKTKRTGSLFEHVLVNEKLSPSEMTHHGDRESSDFESPKKLGIEARVRKESMLNQYEILLEEWADRTEGYSSLLAGTSRVARLENASGSLHHPGLVSIGASVIAPVLTSYVYWILRNAQEEGLRTLYFVARDGYILKEIAERLEVKMQTGIEFRYLYGSRQAWHLPSLREQSDLESGWIFVRSHTNVDAVAMLQRLGIKKERAKEIIFLVGLSDFEVVNDPSAVVRECLKIDEVRAEVLDNARNAREVALEYFKQEGLSAGAKWALVDLGWRGNLQNSLWKIIGDGVRIRGYYFGLRSNAIDHEHLDMKTFLFDGRKGSGLVPRFRSYDCVMEMFCQAPHEMTVDYQWVDDQVVPRLRADNRSFQEFERFRTIENVIKEFATLLPTEMLSMRTAVAEPICELIELFWNSPGAEEARAWGSHHVGSDQASTASVVLAAPITIANCLQMMCGSYKLPHPWFWLAAAKRMTPKFIVVFFEHASDMRRVGGGLLRKFKRILRPR